MSEGLQSEATISSEPTALQAVVVQFGDFSALPRLWIDRNQFQQVFFNLLSNSIKYSDRSNFKVRVEGGEVGDTYTIWFEDWGQGIEEGMEEMIFQPGFREERAIRSDVTGQGIGLTVVRAIVEAHGGRVTVTSLRKPTTFEIILPMQLKRHPSSREMVTMRKPRQDAKHPLLERRKDPWRR